MIVPLYNQSMFRTVFLRRRLLFVLLLATLFFTQAPNARALGIDYFGPLGNTPSSIALDSAGNAYTANSEANTISKITPGGAVTEPFAAVGAQPKGIVIGDFIYVSNSGSNNISKVSLSGESSLFAYTGSGPWGITADRYGNIYTANNSGSSVSKITPSGDSRIIGSTGAAPTSIALDNLGNSYTANNSSNTVTRVTPLGESTLFGTTQAYPYSIAVDSSGNVFTGDGDGLSGIGAISRIGASGGSSLFANLGNYYFPRAMAFDSQGNLYAASYQRVTSTRAYLFKIYPSGAVQNLASLGSRSPSGLVIDSAGKIWISFLNSTAARVSPDPVNPEIAPAPPAVPAKPSASAGIEKATVSIALNPEDARYGRPSQYVVRAAEDVSKNCTITPPSNSCVVENLQADRPYTFTAQARLNSWETGSSLPSDPVTPQQEYLLGVQKSGSGSGAITSTPAGISCGSTCSALFLEGTGVSLQATPDPGSQFVGWSGSCSGAGSCALTMSQAKNVVAVFQESFSLDVSKTAGGSVSSAPAGISCGSDCSSLFPDGTTVELVAWPEAGYIFQGWSGDCQGQETCTLQMNENHTAQASFALAVTHSLGVQRAGTGSGRVLSVPSGVDCGQDCRHSFVDNTPVELQAQAGAGSQFTGWSGACAGTGSCSVQMNQDRNVTAIFTADPAPPGQYNLSVTRSGDGSGQVFSSEGIDCGNICNKAFPSGSLVQLEARASAGSLFQGWSGACTGTESCVVLMSEARAVNASFASDPPQPGFFPVSVLREGTGDGQVASSPLGINCGQTCTSDFLENETISLGAEADPSSSFVGWSGPCTGTGSCAFLLEESLVATAYFSQHYPLAVSVGGEGVVYSDPAGVDCSDDCTANFSENSLVSLRAEPAPGYRFAGWSGACSGQGSCQVTMSGARAVGAQFQKVFTLSVARRGSGLGQISSTPEIINCGVTCRASFDKDEVVVLHADPAPGSLFRGWQGACDSDPCRITMSSNQEAEALFSLRIQMDVKKIKRQVSRKKIVLVSRVYVSSPGEIRQAAFRGKQKWCKTKRRTAKAGTYTLRCKIKPKYARRLTRKKIRLRVQSSFSAYEEQIIKNRRVSVGR